MVEALTSTGAMPSKPPLEPETGRKRTRRVLPATKPTPWMLTTLAWAAETRAGHTDCIDSPVLGELVVSMPRNPSPLGKAASGSDVPACPRHRLMSDCASWMGSPLPGLL